MEDLRIADAEHGLCVRIEPKEVNQTDRIGGGRLGSRRVPLDLIHIGRDERDLPRVHEIDQ